MRVTGRSWGGQKNQVAAGAQYLKITAPFLQAAFRVRKSNTAAGAAEDPESNLSAREATAGLLTHGRATAADGAHQFAK